MNPPFMAILNSVLCSRSCAWAKVIWRSIPLEGLKNIGFAILFS